MLENFSLRIALRIAARCWLQLGVSEKPGLCMGVKYVAFSPLFLPPQK